MTRLHHFLGGSPLAVALKLAIYSLLVGLVLAWLDWTPRDLWFWASDTVRWAWAELGSLGEYMAIGAVVVVPLFIVSRILSRRRPS